ncbi:MAG: DUF2029 domain-containing protein [Chloroflexi bacterium]|nr:MAG: DUF2029 domain-containing protein [Chloroflexota bacterium]
MALAGIPLGLEHLWATLVVPIASGQPFTDFEVYLGAARDLTAGRDPYTAFFQSRIPDYAFNQTYIYPPLWGWLLQPLAAIGTRPAEIAFLVFLQLCIVAFLGCVYLAIGVRDRQELALAGILTVGFLPVRGDLWKDQVDIVLLLVSGLLLLAWTRGDRFWGGLALGLSVAVKLLQAPLGLLLLWGRRWRMLGGALVAGALATAVAAPWYLPEYLLRVLPALSEGTGFRENAAPAAVIERLLHPETFYRGGAPDGFAIRLVALAIAVGVVLLTWRFLGSRPRTERLGRALEVTVAVAATQLLLTVNYHLVFELLPILVLLRAGLQRLDRPILVAAFGTWFLVGPFHALFLNAIGDNFTSYLGLRLWAETQPLAIVALWLGCLRALADAKPACHDLDQAALHE